MTSREKQPYYIQTAAATMELLAKQDKLKLQTNKYICII